MEEKKQKRGLFDLPFLKSFIRSADAKLFPEGALGYFIGPTLALIANSVLANYLNMYMSNVLNITSWANTFFTLLPVISVIMVVAGNIIVGRLMDHNKSRAGKARPLLLLAIPFAVLALLVLFVFMPIPNDILDNASKQTITLVLLAVGYNLWFAIAYPFYYTSHAALVSLSTRNSKSRSLLATIANATSLAAVGACSMILPFFLGLLFVYQTDVSAIPEAVAVLGDKGQTLYYTMGENGAIIYDQIASYNNWKVFVIALMVLFAVGALIEFYFTRERITEESFKSGVVEKKKATPLVQQAKICFKDRFWIIMIIFFILYQLGGMMKNVSQLYFCQAMFADAQGNYSVATGGTFQGTLSIIGAIPTALGMVIAWPLSNKIGKGKAIFCGAILATIGGAIGFIAPDNFYLVVASFVIKALGSTPAMYLSLALLADIMDHQEAQHKVRTDGLTMTIYGAIMAGMTGIATGIMNGVLGAVGYSAENVSSELIRTAMPWIFIGGETICYGLMIIFFIFMRVERFTKFDQIAIVLDQKAAAEAEGVEYVDPATKMKLEEEEAERKTEEARVAALKAKCEKQNLNFEEEEGKYQAAQKAKEEAAAQKKAAAEAKKAEKERLTAEKYAALPDEQKKTIEEKKALKAKKQAEKDAATLVEFNKIRAKAGRPELVLGEDGNYVLASVEAKPAE